jgi:membrane protein implicated in regulation of membrane protease activity
MTTLHPFELTLILAAIVLALEMLTGALVFLSFSVGLFAVAGMEFLFSNFNFSRDILFFAIIAVMTFVGLRLTLRAKGDTKIAEKDINDY